MPFEDLTLKTNIFLDFFSSKLEKTFNCTDAKKYIINFILEKRIKMIEKIQSKIRQFLAIIKVKRNLLIRKILEKRTEAAKKIQNVFRIFLCKNHFKKILSNDILFLYSSPFCTKDVPKISLSIPKKNGSVEMRYSPYLKMFYLGLNKVKLFRKNFKVNFIINNHKVIDSRYEVEKDSKGNYYNLIPNEKLFKKIKERSPRIRREKDCKDFFTFSSAIDDSFIIRDNNIFKSYEIDQFAVSSILRNGNDRKVVKRKNKKVSFNNQVHFFV